MKEISLDLFREGDRKEPFVRQNNRRNSLMRQIAWRRTVNRERRDYISNYLKSVREYQFTILTTCRYGKVEVGQIFSVHDGGLTFLARVFGHSHDSNYDGNWDTTSEAPSSSDQDRSLTGQ